jgi:hypothetical protein
MHTSKVQNFLEDRLGSHLRPDFRGAWSIGVHAHFHTTDLRPDFSDVVGGREEEHGFVSLLTNKSPALQTRNTMAMADAATTFTLQRQLFSHTTLHSSKSVSSAFSFSSSQLPPSRLCCNFWTALSNRSHHHCMQSFGCIASDVSSQQNSFAASAKLVVQVCESRSCSDSRFRAGFFLPVANLQSDKSFSSVILRKQRRTLTAVSSFGTLLQLLDRLSTCQPRIASSRFLARAQQEGKIVETEPEVETGRKLEKEAAAAVTAGIVAQDGSAAIQAAIAAADSAVGIICSFSAVELFRYWLFFIHHLQLLFLHFILIECWNLVLLGRNVSYSFGILLLHFAKYNDRCIAKFKQTISIVLK